MITGPAAAIDRVALVVSDLDRSEDDFVTTLGCDIEQRGDIEPSLTRVLRIPHAHGRRSLLRLGRQQIELLEFRRFPGRRYPPDSTSTDLWFQHMAIVVSDVRHAYQHVLASQRFRPISRGGPVWLPDRSGGIAAFKFRDHDGHPLELIAFRAGREPPEWDDASRAGLFLGVDHTAIAVSDTAATCRFLGSVLGFNTGIRTENYGPEQDALDDVDEVQVSVTRIAPDRPAPRLELLHYHVGTRRPIPPGTASNDIPATHSVVTVPSLDATATALARHGTTLADRDLMMRHEGRRAVLISGPDGHRFLVQERADRPVVSGTRSRGGPTPGRSAGGPLSRPRTGSGSGQAR